MARGIEGVEWALVIGLIDLDEAAVACGEEGRDKLANGETRTAQCGWAYFHQDARAAFA